MADLARTEPKPVSGWAVGGVSFAATMLVMMGIFHAVAGLVALFDDAFYLVTRNYTFALDVTAWGWIHLILGVIVAVTGVCLFAGQTWAGITAVVLAVLSAVVNFFFIPYYPVWSLVLIGLDVWVIWSLTRPDVLRA